MLINERNAAEAATLVKNGSHTPDPSPTTVRRSATIGALATALAKAQAEMKNPPKDSINPHFKSKYADLATVRDVVVPVLAKHGLAILQMPCELDDAPALTTVLAHGPSGEFYETTIRLRPSKADPQGIGSALTYLRRYSLQSLAGVAADDDDDGHAGTHRPAQQPQQHVQPAATPNDKAIVAKLAQRFAQVETEGQRADVWKEVAAAKKAGQLSDAGLAHLKEIAVETAERLGGAA